MRQGRLTVEFRDRTKRFAAQIIRLYVDLPKGHDHVVILDHINEGLLVPL